MVSPHDLDRVVADGARPFGFQDGVWSSPDVFDESRALPSPTGPLDVSADNRAATVFHGRWFNASTFATHTWAERAWGDVPVIGALVVYRGTTLSAPERLAYIQAAAGAADAVAHPVPRLSAQDIADHESELGVSLTFVSVMGIILVVFSGVGAVLLSIRVVRAHRQVRATVAALGATPRALAWSVPIDAGIAHAVALTIGLPLGVIVAALIKHPTLLTPGAPLDPGTTMWGLWWNLSHVPWAILAAAAAATWVLAVASTTVYGFRVARRTPVDELRVAIKERAL